LLCRVAPGRVEEHRLVGEPPVAVAGAADTADRLATEPIREREAQARIDQRGRLAGPGRADEDVPRQGGEGLLRAERMHHEPDRRALDPEAKLSQEPER